MRERFAQLDGMSKWLWVIGLAGSSALALMWARWPRVREPEEVEQRLAEAKRRWRHTQDQALDPDLNGYLSEPFQPFWDRDVRDRDHPSDVEQVITIWSRLSESASDDELASSETGSAIAEALAQFKAIAPALADRMGRPLFVVPATDLTLTTPTLSIIAKITCIQAMLGLARARMAQGESVDSLSALLPIVDFATAQLDRGNLVSEMLACSALGRAVKGVCQVLTPTTTLPAADWRRLTLHLCRAVPPVNWLERCLEVEMVCACASFDLAREGAYALDDRVRLHLVPGMVARERRIYLNLMTGLLARLRSGHADTEEPLPRWMAWTLGRMGWSGPLSFWPGERLRQSFSMHRRTLIGLAAAVSVIAFQAEHGRLPVSLDEIKASGVALPTLEDTQLSYQVSETGARLTLPCPLVAAWDSELAEIALGEWGTQEGGTILIKVPAASEEGAYGADQ